MLLVKEDSSSKNGIIRSHSCSRIVTDVGFLQVIAIVSATAVTDTTIADIVVGDADDTSTGSGGK